VDSQNHVRRENSQKIDKKTRDRNCVRKRLKRKENADIFPKTLRFFLKRKKTLTFSLNTEIFPKTQENADIFSKTLKFSLKRKKTLKFSL